MGSMLISLFTRKLFVSSLLRKIYHQRRYENVAELAQKTVAAPVGSPEKALEIVKGREEALAKEFRGKDKVRDGDMASLYSVFLNRGRFNYSAKSIFAYITSCLCFRNIDKRVT